MGGMFSNIMFVKTKTMGGNITDLGGQDDRISHSPIVFFTELIFDLLLVHSTPYS
jgi:hypothetical protein